MNRTHNSIYARREEITNFQERMKYHQWKQTHNHWWAWPQWHWMKIYDVSRIIRWSQIFLWSPFPMVWPEAIVFPSPVWWCHPHISHRDTLVNEWRMVMLNIFISLGMMHYPLDCATPSRKECPMHSQFKLNSSKDGFSQLYFKDWLRTWDINFLGSNKSNTGARIHNSLDPGLRAMRDSNEMTYLSVTTR